MSKTANTVSPEVRERTVRMVTEHQGGARLAPGRFVSIAARIGCAPHTLNDWLNKSAADSGKRTGIPYDVAERLKALERENRKLLQANEILRKASA